MGTGAEAWAIPAIIGAVGLYQSDKANDAAINAGKPSKALDKMKLQAMQALMQIAQGFDPAKETDQAVGYAKESSAATLAQALKSLSGDYRQAGGVPGNSSAFNVSSQRTADNILGPLQQWIAGQRAQETQKKANLYSQILGTAPGQLGDTYYRQAQTAQSQQYGMLGTQMLGTALNQLFTPPTNQTAQVPTPPPAAFTQSNVNTGTLQNYKPIGI